MTHKKYLSNAAVETLRATYLQPKTILLIFLILFSLSTHAQTRAISLSVKNEPIKTVLVEIQQKSGYRILYNDEVVPDELRVSINAENVSVKTVLETFLANTDLTFLMQSDDLIVITKKEFTRSADEIFGTVVDENNEPVPFANVVQLALPDSTFINGVSTGANGRFSLKRETADSVLLEITFLGYERFQTEVAENNMGTIRLQPQSTLLGEVVVRGNLPQIQIKNDALVVSVQNTALSKAGTGNDLLKRLPMVNGDNGVFSVFGKGKAKIYINNREMHNTSELDNLNSADIRNVEIVTNPGARYDGTVKAVIRVNTVRKAGDGFSFDVRSSYYQSQLVGLTEQLNVNYRKNGWDVFGTFAYYKNKGFQDSKIWQKTFVDTLWTQDNSLYFEWDRSTILGIAGVNYEISPKHFTGAKYTVSTMPYNNEKSSSNSTVLADGAFYDRWQSEENKQYEQKPTHWVNAYYNGTFGEMKADFNTDFYTNNQKSVTNTAETSQEYEDRIINSANNVSNRLIAGKLVLSYPVLGGELSAGSELSDTRRVDDYQTKQGFVPSTKTTFHNQNTALFTEYSKSISNVQVGAGLRYENVRSDYFVNDVLSKEQSRRYAQWFPNLSLSAQLKDVSLQLSYTVKTQRPTYRQLGSNTTYLNRFTLFAGNPFLNPSTIHDATLVGSWKIFQLMVSYQNVKDAVIYWSEQMEENSSVSFTTYRNLEKLPTLNAFVTVSPKFGIWTSRLSVGLLKQWVTITTNKQPMSFNKPMAIVNFNNSFSFPKDFLLTLDMGYQGKGNTQNVYMTDAIVVVNVGITKSFFDDQFSVAVKGHDIFYQNQYGHITYYPSQEYYQHNRYDTRQFELTLRYKFNTARSKYKGTGAGSSERNRL